MAGGYEYKVEEIREGTIGGEMSGDKLEKVLNARAREGWQLEAITSVEAKAASDRAAWRAFWSPSSAPSREEPDDEGAG